MMEQAKALIGRMISGNTEKIALLQKILECSKQQKVALSSNSLNSLLDNIRNKQNVMDEVDIVDQRFHEDFIALKRLLAISSIDQIDASDYPEIFTLKSTVHEIMLLLESIEVLDKENLDEVKTEIDKVKERMREVQSQKRLSHGYRSAAANYGNDMQGFYIDGKK